MDKKRREYIQSCEVSCLEEFTLGGYRQKVLVEGKSKNLPVVIVLHGGPGSPVPFSEGCRGMFPEWTDRAVMVYWDQLGCGINNHPIDDSFTVKTFTDMTADLIKAVKSKFTENNLYLFGVSWGSVLALQTAALIPELIDGVVVYGQITQNLFFNEEVFSSFKNAPESVQRKVSKIFADGANCEYKVLNKNLSKLAGFIRKYTNGYFNKNAEPLPVKEIAKGLISSPDYKLRDFFAAVGKNGYRGNQSLWRELLNINLAPLFKSIKIPYFIMQGDTDIVTSTASVLKVVEECGNPNVKCSVIKDAGHIPSPAAMKEIFAKICETIE